MVNETKFLLQQLLNAAINLIETDTDNADKHARIADSLATYGRRHFGPRFGDGPNKPLCSEAEADE